MRSRLSMLCLSVLLSLSVLTPPALAENLVPNPGFDTDIAQWTVSGASWSGADALGDPTSGALEVAVSAHTGAALQSACFPLAGGERLVYGASAEFVDADPYAARVGAALRFFSEPGCAGEEETTAYPSLHAESAYTGWGPTQATTIAPAGAQSARLRIWLNVDGDDPQTMRVDNAFVASGESCAETAAVLCLQGERFRVTARYRIPDGPWGYAGVRPLSGDSAYLWFFSSSNLELVIKVLDGCGFNDHFWVYAAGLTNLGVELLVTDTLSGETWSFDNPVDEAFPPRQDIEAFAACIVAETASAQ